MKGSANSSVSTSEIAGTAMDDALREYRSHLVSAYQKALEDYDKAIMSLSGGALGISFAFVKDIVGAGPVLHKGYLFSAWLCWGVSITSVVTSFFTSHLSLSRAIKQVDAGTAYQQRLGGRLSRLTSALNASGGLLFLAGIILIGLFVWHNIGVK